MTSLPQSLAFDFDGVLCNGLREYFATAWSVYQQFWGGDPALEDLEQRFYRLRPVVEVGWEMPLVLRAVQRGMSDAEIFAQWPAVRDRLVAQEHLHPAELGQAVDRTRDRWIQSDLEGWLDHHEFYPGIVPRLRQCLAEAMPVVIITTKESRFVQQLLIREGINLDGGIFGKDCQRPKPDTLKQLQLPQPIWFIEDRLAALRAVQDTPELHHVALFLATWGYNRPQDHALANQAPIHPLSLSQFSQPFLNWLSPAKSVP
ncbi:HAD family hydrolase [Lyngbya confervoides]|uniref:HAD family hydrolase n=1 Tax=Lyngbya confervoides BDU141951 TaxID=1574623 RepID=A0ABD4T351_9CYAN|nr:HAD family hydrolase [Lyngbya confervoides]MCM1983196.1 HAD family hydrolase [Lyngbya confervoides BDU141951]